MEMVFQRGSSRGAELEDVGHQAHGGPRAVDVRAARDVLLEDVVLHGPTELVTRDAAAVGDGHVHRQQDGRGGVDGHRGGHAAERQAVEQDLHVVDGADRHADSADLAGGELGIGVVAHLGGQVEGDGEAGLALLEQVAEAFVGLGRGGEAGVLAHRPQSAAVHRRLHATREGELAGHPQGLIRTPRQGRRRCRQPCTGPRSRCPRWWRSGRAAPPAP